jgi:hypothetical protein
MGRLTPSKGADDFMSVTAKRPKQDNPEQSRAFIEKAREIGADDKRSRADELLGRLAKMSPKPRNPRS